MAKAKELINEANPSDMDITVWTDNESPNNEAGDYYEDVLKKLGFNTKLKIINADNYFTVIGNQIDARPRHRLVGLVRGLPAPERLLPAAAGRRKHPADQQRQLRQIDDPELNKKIDKLGEEQLGPEQEAEYAELDKKFMEQAPWAPYGNRTLSTFVSSDDQPRQASSSTRPSART